MSDTRTIDSIIVSGRHRRDIGDISTLARSIDELGLLHPIVVTPGNVLIAGERRLRAMQQLGWTEAPVFVVSLKNVTAGEAAENCERKAFTLSEAVAIKQALEPELKAAAQTKDTKKAPR